MLRPAEPLSRRSQLRAPIQHVREQMKPYEKPLGRYRLLSTLLVCSLMLLLALPPSLVNCDLRAWAASACITSVSGFWWLHEEVMQKRLKLEVKLEPCRVQLKELEEELMQVAPSVTATATQASEVSLAAVSSSAQSVVPPPV